MSGYSFNTTAGASQSTVKPKLAGNSIYSVKFTECELKDVQGVKDTEKVYKQLILKFENEDGAFEHTVWEPRPEDFERKDSEIKNKNGMLEKIPNPSGVETMMLLFKHAIDSINPTVAKQIDTKEKSLGASDWESLRTLVSKILNAGKNTPTKIKLLKNKNGEAVFPGFFSGLTRDGKAFIRNNFIGDKVSFSSYEVDRIKKEASATPTPATSFTPNDSFVVPGSAGDDLDMDFSVSDL